MLKKSKVDQHAMKCGCASVSCVDCGVSFWGDDYRLHTSCMTEAERYEKTVYKGPKKNDTKGRKLTPQEVWMEIINEALSSCPPALTSYLESLSTYDNVPRKEKAFRNFASNSLRLRGGNSASIVDSIWNHLNSIRQEKIKAKEEEKKAEEEKKKDNETCIPVPTTPKANKTGKETKKAVKKAMKKALKKAPTGKLKMKDLRKLVSEKLEAKGEKIDKKDFKLTIKEVIEGETEIILKGKVVSIKQ